MIINITSPMRVSVANNVRSPQDAMNAIQKCALNVSQNLLDNVLMNLMRVLREMRDKTYYKGEIKMSVCQVQQATNY